MKPSTTRGIVRAHRWIGLALCLPLLAITLSGAMLLFRHFLWVPADWRATDWNREAADAALATALSRDSTWRYVDLARPGKAFHLVGEDTVTPPRVFPVGSSTPIPLPARLGAELWLFQLHTRLLVGESGRTAVRLIGPLALASIAAGLVLWWPRRRNWRGRDLLAAGASSRPALQRWHMTWGAAAAVVLLPMFGSGALLAHNPAIRAWLAPLAPPAGDMPPEISSLRFAPGNLESALAAARAAWPDGEPTQLSRAAGTPGRLTVKFRLSGERHPNGRSTLTLDLDQGRVVAQRDARLGGLPAFYDDVLYGFHSGELAGPVQAWLWLAGTLGLGVVTVSGALAWLRGRRDNRRRPG